MPILIETRLSKIFSNEKELVSIYEEALDKSDHKHKVKFQKISTNNTQRFAITRTKFKQQYVKPSYIFHA